MSAVVLAPRELSVEQPDVDRWHLLGLVVVRTAETFRAQQSEDRLAGNGGHEAALMVVPLRVALFRDAVADEGQPRRAQRDQFVRIDWNVPGRLAAERRLRRAVLEEVPGHPVVLARP